MLKEYFYAYEDKYNAAGDLGAGLVFGAEYAACFKPGGGYERGGYADYCSCYENIYLHKGKGYADCQGIDAGGYGKEQHGLEAEGGVGFFVVVLYAVKEHFAADKAKEHKGYPVIHCGDVFFKSTA